MKKIALILCAALLALSLTMTACGKKAPEADAQEPASSEAAAMPETTEEIIQHNLKIDETDIDLIQTKTPAADAVTVTIKTTAGDIKAVLYPSEAPKAVESFLALAKEGYYKDQTFYELLPSVRVSTGSPDETGSAGKTGLAGGEKFADEYSLNLWHFNGALAMNNNGIPDANDSRFYIVQNADISDELAEQMLDSGFPEKVVNQYLNGGGVPNYDFKDTVFGQVIEGMEIVEAIANAPRTSDHRPEEEPTKIVSIDVA